MLILRGRQTRPESAMVWYFQGLPGPASELSKPKSTKVRYLEVKARANTKMQRNEPCGGNLKNSVPISMQH